VSSEQDAQQAQLPVVLLLAISLGSVQGILTSPEGTMARLLTVVPFSSPIILPLRLSLAPIAMREIVISLVVLALSALGMTFVASRLYRVGVLMYGKRPSLREVWRWMWIR
jgi:ABC-2 type transport system permease protein